MSDQSQTGSGNTTGDGATSTELVQSDCGLFTFIVYVVVFGSMALLGLVGNGLSWAVLGWDRRSRGHVASFLLRTMAVADNLFLLAAGLAQISSALIFYIDSNAAKQSSIAETERVSVTTISAASLLGGPDTSTAVEDVGSSLYDVVSAYVTAYVTVCVFPLVHVTQMWTVWITVLVAVSRYVAICRPYQAAELCSLRRVRLEVAAVALSVLVYNAPRFLEFRIEYMDDMGKRIPVAVETSLKQSFIYNIVYENFLYCLFVFLGPLVILVALNTCLIRELVRARRRLRDRCLPDSSGESSVEGSEQNLTLVMIVIIVLFVVCQTPAFVNQLLFLLIGADDYQCGKTYFYYFHVSNLIVMANSSVNFIIYCVLRRQFRQRLVAFCRLSGRQPDVNDHANAIRRTPSPNVETRLSAAYEMVSVSPQVQSQCKHDEIDNS